MNRKTFFCLCFALLYIFALRECVFFHTFVKHQFPIEMDFSLFYHKSDGVLFYVTDHDQNWILAMVKIGYIEIQNSKHKFFEKLEKFCNCLTDCHESHLQFRIICDLLNCSVKCNGGRFVDLSTAAENFISLNFKFPKLESNRHSMGSLIFVGNFGPFMGNNNICFLPRREEIQGCIANLVVNKERVEFNENSFCTVYCSEYYLNIEKCKLTNSNNRIYKCDSSPKPLVESLSDENRMIKEDQCVNLNATSLDLSQQKDVTLSDILLTWRSLRPGDYHLFSINSENFKLKLSVKNSSLELHLRTGDVGNYQMRLCNNIFANVSQQLSLIFSTHQLDVKCDLKTTFIRAPLYKFKLNLLEMNNFFVNYGTAQRFQGHFNLIYRLRNYPAAWLLAVMNIGQCQKSQKIAHRKLQYENKLIYPILAFVMILGILLVLFIFRNKRSRNKLYSKRNLYGEENIYELNKHIRYGEFWVDSKETDDISVIYEEIDKFKEIKN